MPDAMPAARAASAWAFENAEKPRDIGFLLRVNDAQVERADRRTLEHRTANDDEVDLVFDECPENRQKVNARRCGPGLPAPN
jgi:hypothetical protein